MEGARPPRRDPDGGRPPAADAGPEGCEAGEQAGDQRVDLHPDQIQARIAKDPSVWTSHTRALQAAATVTLQAVATRNVTALVDAGEVLDQACEACHQAYWYRPTPEPVTDPPPRQE